MTRDMKTTTRRKSNDRSANGAVHSQSAVGTKALPLTATSNGETSAVGAGSRQQQTQDIDGSANDSWCSSAEASSTVDIAVGKKGGTFCLPFGGQLTVPADAFTKRAVITCRQVLPQDRYQFEPTLSNDERLTSEIYVIDTHGRSFKRPLGLQLSYYPVNRDVTDVGVLWKPSNSSFWQSTESNPGTAADVVNFITSGDGAFVVISYPHCERFDIPAVGCLYSARLHRQVSVRCPKGAVTADVQCDIQIIPLVPAGLQSPSAQADITSATDYFRFTTSVEGIEFKRNLTVKLPLPVIPPSDVDHVTADDIAVCQMVTSSQNGDTSWTIVDGPLKLTKTSVTFETKTLSKYCVVLVKPAGGARAIMPRGTRLADTLNKVEADNDRPRGDILPFIQLSAKQWTLWVECVRKDMVQQAIDARPDMILVKPSSLQLPVTASIGHRLSSVGVSRSWRKDSGASGTGSMNGGGQGEQELRLNSSCSFSLEVAGDVELVDPNGGGEITNNRITYHDTFANNCRQFSIVPKSTSAPNGPKVLTCVLRLHPYTGSANADEPSNFAVRCFDFDIPQEAVADYFYVEPEPEEVAPPTNGNVRESLAAMMASLQTQPVAAPVTQPTAARRDPKEAAEIFNRLTKATRMPVLVPREPRVLSGKSLQSLSRAMPAGINLAVHLDISDSTITGMAFDALANGLNSADITYRILLLWKRRWAAGAVGGGYRTSQDVGTLQVETLAAAAAAIGQSYVASIILDRHRVNKELTADCFTLTPDDDCIESNGHNGLNGHNGSYDEITD